MHVDCGRNGYQRRGLVTDPLIVIVQHQPIRCWPTMKVGCCGSPTLSVLHPGCALWHTAGHPSLVSLSTFRSPCISCIIYLPLTFLLSLVSLSTSLWPSFYLLYYNLPPTHLPSLVSLSTSHSPSFYLLYRSLPAAHLPSIRLLIQRYVFSCGSDFSLDFLTIPFMGSLLIPSLTWSSVFDYCCRCQVQPVTLHIHISRPQGKKVASRRSNSNS